jgi:hypothetical protein
VAGKDAVRSIKQARDNRETGCPDQGTEPDGGIKPAEDFNSVHPGTVGKTPVNLRHEVIHRLLIVASAEFVQGDVCELNTLFPVQTADEAYLTRAKGACTIEEDLDISIDCWLVAMEIHGSGSSLNGIPTESGDGV